MKDDDPIYKTVEKEFDNEITRLTLEQESIEKMKTELVSFREKILRKLRNE